MKKNKKDIMYVKEKYNRFGELSFELHASGKDPLTRGYKVYVKTYKVPDGLHGKKELEQYRLQIQFDWRKEVDKMSSGVAVRKNNILFIDFAKKYVEDILIYNPQAYNHYKTCKYNLKILEEKLGNYLLSDMTPPVISEFVKWLCKRTYKKETVIVKESLIPLIKERKLKLKCLAQHCKISQTTLFVALRPGKHLCPATARAICSVLNVPFEKYYTLTKQELPYSYGANNGVKVLLHGILHEAVRQGLIEHNYASSDYIRAVTGTKGKKAILETQYDISQYIKFMNEEQDIRKKTAFACYIFLGLRNAEVAGLAWKNINLLAKTISIVQNTLYVQGFGTITKDPKSEKSKRIIAIPSTLVTILSEYKLWWDKQKEVHGDLWSNTDKLFVSNNGKDMNGTTLAKWLKDWEIRNGLKLITPHGLRHTNITFQIANGVDIKTVSSRAGHADIQTTLNIYSHYTKEADRQAAETIDKLLKAN